MSSEHTYKEERSMGQLDGVKVAILATNMVEEAELTEPREALEAAGAETVLIAPKEGEVISANHFDQSESYAVDATLEEVEADDFDALLLPGGALNADHLRVDPHAQRFVQAMDSAGKPIAVICHGPWLLISAGLVDGRKLTSYHTIADDIRNAGGEWLDKSVVIDGNWLSSRQPDDLPEFNDAMINIFAESPPDSELLAA
jgi:protease I